LLTVIEGEPGEAMSAAVMPAFSCVELTNVVMRAPPLRFTVAPLTKFVPFTINMNCCPPAVTLLGESDVIAGMGLSMAKLAAGVEVPPPGVLTTTLTVPPMRMAEAGMVAVN
jgi:hypothetical protein